MHAIISSGPLQFLRCGAVYIVTSVRMGKAKLLRLCQRLLTTKANHTSTPLEFLGEIKGGDTLHGYTVKCVTAIPEIKLVAVQLLHDKTGAEHLHLARDDDNNCFGVGFKTVPRDDTGVAHILEHTVLCGSKKYPVRDPFFKMMNRSMATFMNAFTGSDWTFYPFSTQNQADYYNLMSVYMDSVFHPLLRELDFRQEGWRLEHEEPTDPKTPVVFKGVVFNEMKGHFGSPENVYAQMAQNLLYPSTTYSKVSGGEQLSILDLTFEQLKVFHAQHYHPSNSRFITYGNFPLDGHLKHLNQVLQHFEKSTCVVEVNCVSRWTLPREYYALGPVDSSTTSREKCFVGVSYLLSPVIDAYLAIVHSVISQLLVSGPTSPFYKALIDSNIGSEYTPNTGYDGSTKESSFSVGLQGVNREDIDVVKDLLCDTIFRVTKEGFTSERLGAVLHQMELEMKHQSSNFGLSLMLGIITPWIHGADVGDVLLTTSHIKSLKNEEVGFWVDHIQRDLIQNEHNLTLVMHMNDKYSVSSVKKEKKRLDKVLSSLPELKKRKVYTDGLTLKKDQDQPSTNLTCLPSLALADVPTSSQPLHLRHYFADLVPVQISEQPTNGITYIRALSGSQCLPDELKVYIPLFCSAVTKLSTKNCDYEEFSQLCEQCSSGVAVDFVTSSHYKTLYGHEEGVLFSSYSLADNFPTILSLWEELFCRALPIDERRLRTVINVATNKANMDVASSGHIFAMRSAAADLTPAASLSEILGGLTQVKFLDGVSKHNDLSEIMSNLSTIMSSLLSLRSLRCAVNTSASSVSMACKAVEEFIHVLPGTPSKPSAVFKDQHCKNLENMKRHDMNLPVGYAAQCFRTIPYSHEDSPRLEVLSKLLTMKFLHKEIREKGGAYGAGAIYKDGVFSLFSFRDPNAESTLESFEKCIHLLAEGEFSEEDVTEAKLLVLAQLDRPQSPGTRGYTMFTSSITPEMQDSFRRNVFDVTRRGLIQVTERDGVKCTETRWDGVDHNSIVVKLEFLYLLSNKSSSRAIVL